MSKKVKKEVAAAPAKGKGKDKAVETKSTVAPSVTPIVTPTVTKTEEVKKPEKAPKDAAKLAGDAKAKAKRASKGAVNLTGPFKLGPEAEKAKSPAELRMHEGSARYALMEYVLSSKKKTFTADELKEVKGVGDQLKQALSGCVRYEFLAAAQ